MEIISLILWPIMAIMRIVLEIFHTLSGSYGLAIVLLSLVVRFATTPIAGWATRSEERNRRVHAAMEPELAEIRATSKGRERFERTEAVYKRHKYHPIQAVTSLAPLFLQLPFLLSALLLLSDYRSLAGERFLFIPDLARPDGLLSLGGFQGNLLPLLIVAVALAESAVKPNQARGARLQFLIITIVIAVLIYAAPAAVCLYWLTSSSVSLLGTALPATDARPAPREQAMFRAVAVFLPLASLALFAFIFGSEADEMDLPNLGVLLGALAAIVTAQIGFLYFGLHRLRALGAPRLDRPLAVGAALCVAANAYFTAFITLVAPDAVKVALSIAAGALVLLILLRPAWRPAGRFMLAFYIVASLGLYAYTRVAMGAAPASEAAGARVNSDRNVYLIGNESLHSPAALRELYGVDDPPHVRFLREQGFRVLDRAYSADSTTLGSYSRIFNFDRDMPEDEIDRRGAFRSENSVFRAFAGSGYRTQFIYHLGYFQQNPELFTYSYPARTFSQCAFAPELFFYVLCRREISGRINRYLFGIDQWFRPSDGGVPDLAVERIRVASRSDDPWFTFYHDPSLMHSPAAHSYRDPAAVEAFRQRYLSWLPRMTAQSFERIIGTILREDPDAVIIAIGDHGSALTRGADLDEPNPRFSPTQILEDRFGVLLAVYPNDFCRNRIVEGSTTLTVMESVIKCLNGDDSPTPAERARGRTFYWHGPRSVDRYARD